VTVLYADTSALVRSYFADEPDNAELRHLLLDGDNAVVTSELTRVELASAVAAAARSGRLQRADVVLDRFDGDCGDDGPVTMLRLDPVVVLPTARELVLHHRLGTLDAVHLAVALTTAVELADGDAVAFVTRDDPQAAVAAELGLAVV